MSFHHGDINSMIADSFNRNPSELSVQAPIFTLCLQTEHGHPVSGSHRDNRLYQERGDSLAALFLWNIHTPQPMLSVWVHVHFPYLQCGKADDNTVLNSKNVKG